jgi:hypothetical protein
MPPITDTALATGRCRHAHHIIQENHVMPDKVNAEQPDNEEQEQPAEPLNRAERRAKGKGTAQQAHGKQHFVPKGNAGGGTRMYSNRRSG